MIMEDNGESDGEPDAARDAADGEAEDGSDEEEQFDIALAASHSYMGGGLVAVSGRSVLEEGWVGRLPAAAHHGTVFPGETVPMLLSDEHDMEVLTQAINQDKLFGLLCPDETGTRVCGYGVVCEVFEAGGGAGAVPPAALTFKARATHRFRFAKMPKRPYPLHQFTRMRPVEVVVLPELRPAAPLRHARLASLDPHRAPRSGAGEGAAAARVRALDAALTPWPQFVYEIFDFTRMRDLIKEYFRTINMEKLPEEAVSLSFWVASNLPLAARDRLALFVVDHALLRLHLALRFITTKSVLCCAACGAELARREHALAMSSDGVHSNYTNPGGYMHDIVTVSRAINVEMSGAASSEYSWFPGYAWSIALCAVCAAHVGWRFEAMRRALRPQQFFGLCRNNVQPRALHERAPAD